MQVPLQISFVHLDHSNALESIIKDKMEQLDNIFPYLISARVVVGLSEKRKQQGNLYHVRIDLTLPGNEILVDRNPPLHQPHEDPYLAVRDAFRAARRQLEDYSKLNSREKKRHHEKPLQGIVIKILLENDGGFLKTSTGREVYFNKNSVLGRGFDFLNLGDEVRFVEEMGENGPQASSVERVGKWGKHEPPPIHLEYKS